jgi:hypothetical protein
MTGLLILTSLRKWRQKLSPYLRLFFLWTGFHCINFFLGGIISGTITQIGFGYALDYLFNRPVLIYIILDVLTLSLLFLFGYKYSRTFLGASPSKFWVQHGYKSRYLLFTGIFPWLIGSAFLFLVKIPDHDPQHISIVSHDLLLTATMGFILIAMLFNNRQHTLVIKVTSVERRRKIHWIFATITITFLLAFRLLLTSTFYALFD